MKNSLIERLEEILVQAQGKPVSVSTLIQKLAKRGYAALIVLFSLPFCLPIQIPGLSTPFGIILMFIGLRIAFGKRIWLPQKFLSQTIPYDVLSKIATFLKKMLYKLRFFLGTRWTFLTQNPALQIVNGLLVATLAFLMALPLPIPFTNLLSAFPLVAFGLGMLEDDGLMIIIAYVLSALCFALFIGLFLFGKAGIALLLKTF